MLLRSWREDSVNEAILGDRVLLILLHRCCPELARFWLGFGFGLARGFCERSDFGLLVKLHSTHCMKTAHIRNLDCFSFAIHCSSVIFCERIYFVWAEEIITFKTKEMFLYTLKALS